MLSSTGQRALVCGRMIPIDPSELPGLMRYIARRRTLDEDLYWAEAEGKCRIPHKMPNTAS